jgi:hypothetical protein
MSVFVRKRYKKKKRGGGQNPPKMNIQFIPMRCATELTNHANRARYIDAPQPTIDPNTRAWLTHETTYTDTHIGKVHTGSQYA